MKYLPLILTLLLGVQMAFSQAIDPPRLVGLAGQMQTLAENHLKNGEVEKAKEAYRDAIQLYEEAKAAYEEMDGEERSVARMAELIEEVERKIGDIDEQQAALDRHAGSEDEPPSIWDQIDLTSPQMKPKPTGVPWWVYAGGGAVVAGVGVVVLSDRDDDDPDLVANDLSVQVDCGEGGTVNPLSNDQGVGLQLQDFSAAPGLVSRDGNSLVIDAGVTENFTITYTVRDANGNTAQATIHVQVNLLPVNAPEVQLETERGTAVQINLFDLILCEDCELLELGDHPDLDAATYNSAGDITLIPDSDFFGTLQINYTITRPPCPPVASSTIFLEVTPDGDPPIANDVNITVSCGEGGAADPLANDEGEGLSLESFTDVTGWVTQEGDLLIISPDAFEDFEIVYTVINEDGLSAEATVFVNVEVPPFTVQDLNFQSQPGGELEFNLLEIIGCTDCELLNVDQPAGIAEIDFSPDGLVSVVVDPDFTGQAVINYTVRDGCRTEASAIIALFVSDEPCEIDGELVVQPSDCGLDNGVIVFATEELFGAYNFLIDGEPTADTVENLAPGSYVFTVIDAENENCREDFTGIVDENPFDVSLETEITPGNCHTSGDLLILVNEGPTISDFLFVSTDFGDFEYPLVESEFSLLQLMEGDLGEDLLLGPVQLTFVVEGAEERCNQEFDFEIPEEEVPFEVEDAAFTLVAGEEFTLNFLEDYAIGEELSIVEFDDISGADFHVEPNGLISFSASQPGEYVSSITIVDICGREITASIGFVVEMIPCREFEVEFLVTPSACGVSTGFVAADIIPFDDDLVLTWSNGQLGLFLEDVSTGTYILEIFDPETDCTEEYEVFVPEEEEGDYIVSTETIAGSCNTPPELIVDLASPSGGNLNLEAISPEGEIYFADVPQGEINWVDLFPLSSGLWQFTIIDEIAGADCAQSVIIELPEPDLPELTLVDVIPPSGPGASDGSIIINLVGGFPPYTLFVNDEMFSGLEPPGNFQIDNVSTGIYEIVAMDNFECFTDVLVVQVEASFTGDPWSMQAPGHFNMEWSGQSGVDPASISRAVLSEASTGSPELPGFGRESTLHFQRSSGFFMQMSPVSSRFSFSGRYHQANGMIADPIGGISAPFSARVFQPGLAFKPLDHFDYLDVLLGFRHSSFEMNPGVNGYFSQELKEWPLGVQLDYPVDDQLRLQVYGNLLFREVGFDQLRGEYGLNFTWQIR